ncbi:hypothetical protein MPER_05571, partial [Moniliophthora perniciosa FA553]
MAYKYSARYEAIPMLLAIERSAGNHEGLKTWLVEVAEHFGALINELGNAEEEAKNSGNTSNVHTVAPVTVVHTGGRGRPRKIPNPFLLHEAMKTNRSISKAEYARKIHISRGTLYKYMDEFGIQKGYTDISDKDLDSLAREEYRVPRPNAMWHLDGHHKLIRWGIVIHGIIDGFCRTVVGLQASSNNQASTVLGVFAAAVQQYGWPSRMRGDRGGENKKVAVVMIRMRGLNRASFMWGKSTQNTRIERLW